MHTNTSSTLQIFIVLIAVFLSSNAPSSAKWTAFQTVYHISIWQSVIMCTFCYHCITLLDVFVCVYMFCRFSTQFFSNNLLSEYLCSMHKDNYNSTHKQSTSAMHFKCFYLIRVNGESFIDCVGCIFMN